MTERLKLVIRGAVQGVGFRPFVFRLAHELGLKGFVRNSTYGVFIEVDGEKSSLEEFLLRIQNEKPPRAIINSLEFSFLDKGNFNSFEILESESVNELSALILPDIAVCDDCLRELFDPSNRRYLYPFINCTNCGPRFSIIESLPYDRPNTSMKIFQMCDECRSEYENPFDRRFHAQPIACPVCGPHIELWDENGKSVSAYNDALELTINKIKDGCIIALKGLGGFQLVCDARDEAVIAKLRERKHREEKPFALMFPNLKSVKELCEVSKLEERLLYAPESPIVLLKKHKNSIHRLPENLAPGNPYLGIMLPYTPLHHLLMNKLGIPIVATSGNLSEEPMCIDEKEALNRLKGIADYFLVHNRPIVRHVDDSIARIVLDREMILRRARGYAPLPIEIEAVNSQNHKPILAVGGHLKNTIALKINNNVFISQHIGDLSTEEAFNTFTKVIDDFKSLYNAESPTLVCDFHPDYSSTLYAKSLSKSTISVQHHLAHILSCRVENGIEGEALGISWDGTGYGDDGNIWGGEFFVTDDNEFKHIAQFRNFRLPGGEIAIKESRRSALGALFEIFGKDALPYSLLYQMFNENELKILIQLLEKGINSPRTSSVGRLFDAVSSILGLSYRSNFEGQSAMKLEFVINPKIKEYYEFELIKSELITIDWRKIIEGILIDLRKGIPTSTISTKFHNTLVKTIISVVKDINISKVILSGGCFQNVYLLEKAVTELTKNKFKVYWHQRVPPNDGGISLGQVALAHYNFKKVNFNNFISAEMKKKV